MTFELQVAAVDGETWIEYGCQDAASVLAQLRGHDHEGASVTLIVNAHNEEAYRVLEAIVTAKSLDSH